MSKLPPPPLPDPSYDPDEEIDDGRTAWDDALYYAERGDESLLIAVLNGDTSLAGDERHVRDFIVGRLTGKIKRPRGRPRPHDDWTFAIDFDGKPLRVRKKGGPWYDAAAFVRHHEAEFGRDEAIEKAVKKFGKTAKMDDESLRKWLTSGPKERAKRFGINPAR